MRRIVFASIWCLILLAAAYDSYFAWRNRSDFISWEINPVARWVVRHFCFEVMVAVKASGILFAAAVAFLCYRKRHRLGIPLTLLAAGCYLFLSVHYVVGTMTDSAATTANEPVMASRAVP
jgi:hypothetical protein